MKLLLATGNQGKVKDLQALLKDTDFEIVSLADVGEVVEVEEDADTFIGNARKKARGYLEQTGLPTLADDSGLIVDALGGAPGVHSARYAGEPANDAANVRKLLDELAEYKTPEERRARFRCELVFLSPDGVELTARGDCEGHIALKPRGQNGFGYDPVFVHPAHGGLSMGEVTREEKNAVSHRGQALRLMKRKLLDIYG